MKMKPHATIISYAMAGCVAGTEMHQPADMPHAHEESKVPEGPNTRTLSFARNGAITSAAVVQMSLQSFSGIKFTVGPPKGGDRLS